MKIKTKTMRVATLKCVNDQLAIARKHHPKNENILREVAFAETDLRQIMFKHDLKQASAIDVFMAACKLAALAIRAAEDGDAKHQYGEYRLEAQFDPLTALRVMIRRS